MDKNDRNPPSKTSAVQKPSSSASQMELHYINPPNNSGGSFKPQLLSPEELAMEELGYFRSKFWPACKQNPVVPIGFGMTIGAISMGLYYLATDQRYKSHMMMRYRVGFQFVTLVGLVGGFYYRDYKNKLIAKFDASAEMDDD
ncbi:Respiratory supercomplex factor 1 [Mactra antiquata]